MADRFVIAEPVMNSILDYFSFPKFTLSVGPVSELGDFSRIEFELLVAFRIGL
jgi:hypothetical protein